MELLKDKKIFEEIFELKAAFKKLFINISNNFPQQRLIEIYPESKGCKVSIGNELNHCPYQVLDIFRNFDKTHGFNIRVLNWWGHGLFVFVFFGKEQSEKILKNDRDQIFLEKGYLLPRGKSPFDYGNFYREVKNSKNSSMNANDYLSKFNYLLFAKELVVKGSPVNIEGEVLEELERILQFRRI
ncbi:hypothetical protein [Litoribacter populi]|uniref:hypothetical protein n=1 Tax=Litoribacter populi TaxID=2598460 RepID=UPI00117F327F|nr:hypothetical protein [Litoribacter populi]